MVIRAQSRRRAGMAAVLLFGASAASAQFGAPGSLVTEEGKGSFRFGVSSSATQIEDEPAPTDFYLWALPVAQGGLGGAEEPIGDAVKGFTNALADVGLLQALGADTYRFGIEWARIEPERDVIDWDAVQHYRDLLEALAAAGIRPNVTVHHFSSPLWISNPADPEGSAAGQLGGFDDVADRPEIVSEIAQHASLLGQQYGDLVDEWSTFNEPNVLLANSYRYGAWPPQLADPDAYLQAARTIFEAHVAIYDALALEDTVDADADGVAAAIGMTIADFDIQPVDPSEPTQVVGAEFLNGLLVSRWPQAFYEGGFDENLDGVIDPSEEIPSWQGKIDWLGLQIYASLHARPAQGNDLLFQDPVFGFFAPAPGNACLGGCAEPDDPSFLDRGHRPVFATDRRATYEILVRNHERFPGLPLIISENGLYTDHPKRRAQYIVRMLEEVEQALADGVDVRGYLHWSLMDNWEWGSYTPKFGLFAVDRADFSRSVNEATIIFAIISILHDVPAVFHTAYGGTGPMASEYSDVSGRVWQDDNGNGIREPGEPGIPGITLRLLDLSGNPVMATSIAGSWDVFFDLVPAPLAALFDIPVEVTTDANGEYRFDGQAAGTFAVGRYAFDGLDDGIYLAQFDLPPGSQPTLPFRGPFFLNSDLLSSPIGFIAPVVIGSQGVDATFVDAGVLPPPN